MEIHGTRRVMETTCHETANQYLRFGWNLINQYVVEATADQPRVVKYVLASVRRLEDTRQIVTLSDPDEVNDHLRLGWKLIDKVATTSDASDRRHEMLHFVLAWQTDDVPPRPGFTPELRSTGSFDPPAEYDDETVIGRASATAGRPNERPRCRAERCTRARFPPKNIACPRNQHDAKCWATSITAAGAATLLAHSERQAPPKRPTGSRSATASTPAPSADRSCHCRPKSNMAARAGYQGIEPWVNEIDAYVASGGSLPDLRKRIGRLRTVGRGRDRLCRVDRRRRRAACQRAGRGQAASWTWPAQLGCQRLAAPPAGISQGDKLPELTTIAERYRALLELGDQQGVVPQLELWGFARVLSKLSEVAYVAAETGHPQASLLLDSYHLHKGGSGFETVRLISGGAGRVSHQRLSGRAARSEITDAYRVFPGDGAAPLDSLFRALRDTGFRGMLSLEVFNREYWTQDALLVARSGLEKTRDAVLKALG